MDSDVVPRVVSLLLLLFGTFFFGTLPILVVRRLQKGREWNSSSAKGGLITSFLMCFGGGVLFATCFIHLLPEVRESFHDMYEHGNGSDHIDHDKEDGDMQVHHIHRFPLPEFLVCAGFLAVYFVEEILHAALGHVHKHAERPEIHGHSHSPAVLVCSYRENECTEGRHCSTETQSQNSCEPPAAKANLLRPDVTGYGSTSLQNSVYKRENSSVPLNSKPETYIEPPARRHHHGHSHGLQGTDVKVSFGGLLIVVALSFHSVFEGLAIGLQKNSRDVWTMFFAVAIHKFVIAFVVGLEVFVQGARSNVVIIYMVIFSVMSPIGIMVGLISQLSLGERWESVNGYMNALATGTLLYVTFFEVLQREKNSQLSGLLQLLAVCLGFGLMVAASFFND